MPMKIKQRKIKIEPRIKLNYNIYLFPYRFHDFFFSDGNTTVQRNRYVHIYTFKCVYENITTTFL